MMTDSFPLLSLCLVWPLLGAMSLAGVRCPLLAKRVALAVAAVELLFTLAVLVCFDANNGAFQLLEDRPWLPGLNSRYQLGVDGISVMFLPMTALLTVMVLLAGWHESRRLTHFHLALLLVLEAVTIGVFTALDLVLFFLFWEMTLPPIFFLTGLWGVGAERRQAAMKYTLFMLFGGVPLLFAIVWLALQHGRSVGGELSFSLLALLDMPLPAAAQGTLFMLLLLGFAVKAPLLPWHTWLPTVAMQAPIGLSALLTGLKLGIYGIVRFAIPLAPAAANEHRWLLAIAGAVTMVYGALLALQQTNLRRLLAYSSISHVGLVIIGLTTFNLQGVQGAVMQLLNFGLIAAGLMLLAGMLQQRLGSNDLVHLGGLAKPMPRLASLFFLFVLAGIGVPGTNGFVAELLMLVGAVAALPTVALAALFTAVLAAAYTLGYVRRSLWGPVLRDELRQVPDLLPREMLALAIPAMLILCWGFMPQPLLNVQQRSIELWVQRVQNGKLPVSHLSDSDSASVAMVKG